MAIQRLSAFDTGGSYEFTIWMDDSRTVLTEDEQLGPDPESVEVIRFGKVDGQGAPLTPEQAWALCREEATSRADRGEKQAESASAKVALDLPDEK